MSLLKICKDQGRISTVIQWDFLKSIIRHPSLPINPIFLVTGPKAPLSLLTPTSLLIFLTHNTHLFSFFCRIPDSCFHSGHLFPSHPHKLGLQTFSCLFTSYSRLPNKDLETRKIGQEPTIKTKNMRFLGHRWFRWCS